MSLMEVFYLDNEEYHLTTSEAAEVDKANEDYPVGEEGDKAFNKWFADFLKRKHIRPVNRRMARWWTGASNSTDDTLKLAMTLRSQRAVLSVMDPEHNLSVEYSQKGESTWDGKSKVVIPDGPAREATDLYDAINITSGYTVHEAAHSKNTRQIDTREMKTYRQNKVNWTLVDLLEDDRIEVVEMQENPGFQGYLDNRDTYLWDHVEAKDIYKALPSFDKSTYKDRIIVAAGVPSPIFEPRMREILDPSWFPFMDAVKDFVSNKYSSHGTDMTDKLAMQLTDEFKSMLEITPEDEQEENKTGEARNALGKMQGCSKNEGLGSGLTPAEATQIEELIEQEVEQLKASDPMFLPEGDSLPNIVVYKPKVTNKTAIPRDDGLLAKAKAAFEFRRAAPRADERMMLSGELDEDELYRLSMGDMRVFRDITEEVLPSAAVYFLVDLSGSMASPFGTNGESRLTVAQKMANLFLKALHTRPNVKTKVLGHTGDMYTWGDSGGYTRKEGAVFYRIWEEGDPLDRISLIHTLDSGNNYDSYAIAWAGKMLAEEQADQKLLIVLSDGQPAGDDYGGRTAMAHVRKHVDALERKGIDTIQISMHVGLSEGDQKIMFKHYTVAPRGSSYATIIKSFQQILLKVGRKG